MHFDPEGAKIFAMKHGGIGFIVTPCLTNIFLVGQFKLYEIAECNLIANLGIFSNEWVTIIIYFQFLTSNLICH